MMLAGYEGLQFGRLATVLCAVRVHTEEVGQPVVDIVWNVELSQLLQQCGMPYRVKRFAEVQGYDYDIWI